MRFLWDLGKGSVWSFWMRRVSSVSDSGQSLGSMAGDRGTIWVILAVTNHLLLHLDALDLKCANAVHVEILI